MALGATFSAAEVIPLTFLTLEAWSFLQLGAVQGVPGGAKLPHFWAVMFLASVGFGNFLGAGVFGYLIDLPIVSYYEIGTSLTLNHAHAAMMGVLRDARRWPITFCAALRDSGRALVGSAGASQLLVPQRRTCVDVFRDIVPRRSLAALPFDCV